MLMKTYKYSHLKLCKPAVPEPPPPPPPEPKAKAKRVAKPRIEKPIPAKPEFNGNVSFTHIQETTRELIPAPPDPYTALRQQRMIVKTQRVKHLISQAI